MKWWATWTFENINWIWESLRKPGLCVQLGYNTGFVCVYWKKQNFYCQERMFDLFSWMTPRNSSSWSIQADVLMLTAGFQQFSPLTMETWRRTQTAQTSWDERLLRQRHFCKPASIKHFVPWLRFPKNTGTSSREPSDFIANNTKLFWILLFPYTLWCWFLLNAH